jgi:hypothetical protein
MESKQRIDESGFARAIRTKKSDGLSGELTAQALQYDPVGQSDF